MSAAEKIDPEHPQEPKKKFYILRWIGVLPAAIVGALVLHLMFKASTKIGVFFGLSDASSTITQLIWEGVDGFVFSFGFVCGGLLMAPIYSKKLSYTLAAFSLIILGAGLLGPSTTELPPLYVAVNAVGWIWGAVFAVKNWPKLRDRN